LLVLFKKKILVNFIPAKEHPLYLWFFYYVTAYLLKRRFNSIDIEVEYHPTKNTSTLFYLNHNYWWDALMPNYLNRRFFSQKARGMMDIRELKKYPFFTKIGAFSVDPEKPRSSIYSLKYALNHLQTANASIYIFPEGEIVPVHSGPLQFKRGLKWLENQASSVDLVPIAIYIDYSKSSKPNLHINIGSELLPDEDHSRYLEKKLTLIKNRLHPSN